MRFRNIVLVGFMGVGKDSVAREIAGRTDYTMLSTDHLIELKNGLSVRSIFKKMGEKYFRNEESEIVNKIAGLNNTVVATGGGILLRKKNQVLLKKMGYVIVLDAHLRQIKKRLARVKNRPLLEKNDIEMLYKKRQKIYTGNLKIDTSEKKPEQIAQKIIERLKLKRSQPLLKTKKIILKADSRTYPIYVGYNLFSHPDIIGVKPGQRALIISNPLVAELYAERLIKYLNDSGVAAEIKLIPDGEEYKNIKEVVKVCDFLFTKNFSRDDLIIGLGGGVVCDIAGFIGAIYKRGMGLVLIPTTLLAQVDAAVGGKNGVNFRGKNMLGTFYQPDAVFCDLRFLKTLSEQDVRNGLAEVIKYGIIRDRELFMYLKANKDDLLRRDINILNEIIVRSIKIKASVVNRDETERLKKRQVLNFGHTVGHIIETETAYQKLSHGEAVAIGMAEESRWAYKKGYLEKNDMDDIVRLLSGYRLPTELPQGIGLKKIRKLILQDKKIKSGRLILPIPCRIGRVRIKEVRCERYLS